MGLTTTSEDHWVWHQDEVKFISWGRGFADADDYLDDDGDQIEGIRISTIS